MKILCIIPARKGSTRLPNKMLADIQGEPLIKRTYMQAARCPDFSRVVVATDSDDIAQVVKQTGGETVMPEGDYITGSDRVAAAARIYPEADVVVNLQGDEPFVQPDMLSKLVEPFYESEPPVMSTLANPIDWDNDYQNPAMVKVILDKNNNAIYFSRSPIPFIRQQADSLPVYHHIGLYAYQRDFLQQYTQWQQTPLEISESLEQLRALENGYQLRVGVVEHRNLEINEPEDLEAAQLVEVAS